MGGHGGAAPTWCSQRRHPPQPYELPTTTPAEGSRGTVRVPPRGACGAEPLRFVTYHISRRCKPMRQARANRHGSLAGSVRGSAPPICDIPRSGEVRSSTTPAALAATAWGMRDVRGATRPAPAGGASPATPHGALRPRDPRIWGQRRFGRAGTHAVRCSARAGADERPLSMRHRSVAS
jgi:hypothetical protein